MWIVIKEFEFNSTFIIKKKQTQTIMEKSIGRSMYQIFWVPRLHHYYSNSTMVFI